MNTLTEFFHAIKEFFTGLFVKKAKFNISVILYNTAQFVPVQKGCTGFMFTNVGDTIASVNEMIIYPGTPGTILGDSRSIGAHKNDVYQGNIQLKFIAPINALPSVEIVQVFYADEQV